MTEDFKSVVENDTLFDLATTLHCRNGNTPVTACHFPQQMLNGKGRKKKFFYGKASIDWIGKKSIFIFGAP
jgi:hypothetical protein